MKVILLQDSDTLGSEGDVVTVKPGFGRNFLIPRGLAAVATPNKVKQWQEERRQAARKLAAKKGDAERLAAELENMEVIIRAKVGEERRIFGSVTSQQIVEGLAAQGVRIDRRQVELEEDIRMLGVYTATVRVHSEVSGQVKIRVEPEGMRNESEPESSTPESASTEDEAAEPAAEAVAEATPEPAAESAPEVVAEEDPREEDA